MGMLSEDTIVVFERLISANEIFSVLWSLVVLGFTYSLILRFEKKQLTGETLIPRLGLNWLKIMTFVFFFLCILWMISIYDELKNGSENVTFYYVLWVCASITIYILGHFGIYRFGILQEQIKLREFSKSQPILFVAEKTVASQNKNIEAFEIFIRQEKNYLDNNLSLDVVAEKLDINKSYLSRIINAQLGKNFTDYVNELRVEEAKTYMGNTEFANYTLVAIGLEAGFNSKTTFNNAFKKFTGKTPSEYRKAIKYK